MRARFFPQMLLLCGMLGASGCVQDPWAQYYSRTPSALSTQTEPCAQVQIEQREDIDPNIFFELFEKGYAPIGYVEFNGTENYMDEAAIRKQAEAQGACICYYGATFSHKEKGLDVVSALPAATGGMPQEAGAKSTTSLGERERKMYDYVAIYAGKDLAKRPLGIIAIDAPEHFKKQLKTDSGVLVIAVRQGSRADRLGLHRGDVLMAVNSVAATRASLRQWYALSDTPLTMTIFREGKQVELGAELKQ